MHKPPYSAGIWNLNIIMLPSMFVVRAMNRPTRYMLKAHVIVSSFILLISSLFLAADGGECKKWVGGEFMPANKLKLLLLKCAMCFFGEVGHFSLPGHRLYVVCYNTDANERLWPDCVREMAFCFKQTSEKSYYSYLLQLLWFEAHFELVFSLLWI